MTDPAPDPTHTARIVAATLALDAARATERRTIAADRAARVRLTDAEAQRATALCAYDAAVDAVTDAQADYEAADQALAAAIADTDSANAALTDVHRADRAARTAPATPGEPT